MGNIGKTPQFPFVCCTHTNIGCLAIVKAYKGGDLVSNHLLKKLCLQVYCTWHHRQHRVMKGKCKFLRNYKVQLYQSVAQILILVTIEHSPGNIAYSDIFPFLVNY